MAPTDRGRDQRTRGAFAIIRTIPFLAAGLLLSAVAEGANWAFTPRLGLAEIYTDNVRLQGPQAAEEDYITELTAGFSVNEENPRLDTALDYRLQRLMYAKNEENNEVFHQIRGKGNAILVPQHLFLDAGLELSQSVLSRPRYNLLDNINILGERRDIITAGVSPYYTGRVGNADLTARYGYNKVIYETAESGTDLPSDSVVHRVDVGLDSRPSFSHVKWSFDYSGVSERRDDDADPFKRQSALGRIDYGISRMFDVSGVVGYETSDVGTGVFVADGFYGAAGLGWHLGRRLDVSALYGTRYKTVRVKWMPSVRSSLDLSWRERDVGLNPGRVWSADLRLGTRHTSWGARYEEEVTTVQQIQLSETVFVDPGTGEVVETPVPGQTVIPINFTTLSDSVLLRERTEVSGNLTRKRLSLGLVAFDESRERQVSGDTERFVGGSVSLSIRFGRDTRLLVAASGTEINNTDGSVDDWSYGNLGLKRELGRHLSGAIDYRYSELASSVASRDYEENRVTARVNLDF